MNHFLRPVLVLAGATYRELIRQRLLIGIGFVAALITALSFFLATVSLDQNARVLHNIGLATITLSAVLITVFVTVQTIARDFDGRMLYLLFPKPIGRGQYVLGRYLGLMALVATTLVTLGGLFALGTLATGNSLISDTLINLGYAFLELGVVAAVVQLFASFTAPLNATLYGFAFYIIGHSFGSLKEFFTLSGNAAAAKLIDGVGYVLPNLDKFDVRAATLYNIPLPFAGVATTILYAVTFSTIALILTTAVVRKQEV